MLKLVDEAVDYIRARARLQPRVGVILGSGLGAVAEMLEPEVSIPYDEIPHAIGVKVAGHSGRLVIGTFHGVPVCVMQGRIHYYEGYEMDDVVFLARVLGRLGMKTVILTNAAGAVNESFKPGDLMLIRDHIGLLVANPLRGPNIEELGERFPDMTEVYSSRLRGVARVVAAEAGIELREGVYVALSGPTYETPAEVRMLRALGADATGMSTVPEAIVLAHMNVELLGISCITNMAAGILPQKLTHQEVIDTTTAVKKEIIALIGGVVGRLGESF